ncbi:MAG: TatCy [Candidatus Woesebacteria bacterium GW2011_GWB1_43_14]|uniref:Sec-independent protein translocase protein TatC n=1 Tax=Candidatus Woesebacteria bacterium GW2011_GWB1_43_14 TaxID=1618578 RepID=A0A0G1FUZ7_9BACT|nr:MAG: TatCy [Candidatus Woesebacteria bacterium GW2011_GWB1_43_14]
MKNVSSADKYSPFLIEVRRRILFTLSVFAISTIVGFVSYEQIIRLLVGALSLNGINIVFTSPFQFINLAIACGFGVGLVLVFPLIIYQVLSFLKPALRKKEYKMIIRFIPLSFVLFLVGFSFGAMIMKWQIQIFLERASSLGIGNVLDISHLLTTVLLTSTLMGIGFQFPIVLLLLMRIGVIKHEKLSKRRPWIYLGSFIFAILLPVDSILADIFLALPLIILFELTLILNRGRGK